MVELLKVFEKSKHFDQLQDEVRAKLGAGVSCIPLFTPLKALNDKTLFQHLSKYEKYKQWTLVDFINLGAVKLNERDAQGRSLMYHLVAKSKLDIIKVLLLKLPYDANDFADAPEAVNALLDYRPGSEEPSIREYASKRYRDVKHLNNMIYDFEDTTDADSSEATDTENEELTTDEKKRYANRQRYNIGKNTNRVRLIAARGVHFLEHFSGATRLRIKDTHADQHPTFSQSTLFDAGYDADSEPSEKDPRIVRRHKANLKFLADLKTQEDKKEKTSDRVRPCATRNAIRFDNLYWRFIQAYINSYSFMFNHKSITTNFGFATSHNPVLSLSYDIVKAMMYASGLRFSLEGSSPRRDPHYRRSTGKPKHPSLGYVDIYSFDVEYVRERGADRILAYNAGLIRLSNLYLSEAELILPSMIEKKYHYKRRIVVAPSFAGSYNADTLSLTGIPTKAVFTRYKNELQALPKGRHADSGYAKWLARVTNYAVEKQAVALTHTVQATLFKSHLVQAYDHGDHLESSLPRPTH